MMITGLYTALITPFSNGRVDYGRLKEIVEHQIAGGVDGILPTGTTGESPTLSVEEHLEVIEKVIEFANGRCRIMAGTGANSTEEAVKLTACAKKMGADCSLQVTPYYNKPTQEGLYRHFSKIADDCGLPVVLYNVPGRTGTAIAADTVARLAANPNVIALKEAGGSVERVSEVLNLCDITVMSGDDSLTLPMLSLGAHGVISVASHLFGTEIKSMIRNFKTGDVLAAKNMHQKLYPCFKKFFMAPNPVPIKAALAYKGLIEDFVRRPLVELSQSEQAELISAVNNFYHD